MNKVISAFGIVALILAFAGPVVAAEKTIKTQASGNVRAKCVAWLNANDFKKDAEKHPERIAQCVANGGPPR